MPKHLGPGIQAFGKFRLWMANCIPLGEPRNRGEKETAYALDRLVADSYRSRGGDIY
jgi:hypothetical protein